MIVYHTVGVIAAVHDTRGAQTPVHTLRYGTGLLPATAAFRAPVATAPPPLGRLEERPAGGFGHAAGRPYASAPRADWPLHHSGEPRSRLDLLRFAYLLSGDRYRGGGIDTTRRH